MPSANTTFGSLPGNRHYSYFWPSVELWLLAQAQTLSPGADRHRALLNRPRPELHLIRYSFCLYSSLLIRKCCSILPGHRSISARRAVSPASSSPSSCGDFEVVLMVALLLSVGSAVNIGRYSVASCAIVRHNHGFCEFSFEMRH